MRSIWNSIRSTVTVILVITLCVFLIGFVYMGKIEGKEALRVLETVVLIVLAYYFARNRSNGDTPPAPTSKSLRMTKDEIERIGKYVK